jgi:hypothetical protein
MSQTVRTKIATLLAYGCLISSCCIVLNCGTALARTDSPWDDEVAEVGWWTPSCRSPDPCGPETAGNYFLPGDPRSPVIIDNGACPPSGSIPLPAGPYPAAPVSAADPLLPYAKSGPLQTAEFTTTYLPRDGGGGIGFVDLDAFASVALPIPVPGDKSVLLLTPDAQTHFVDGPDASDLPPRLYDASLLVQFLGQLPNNVLFDVGAEPGWHSDGDNTSSSHDFRTAFYGAIGYRFSPTFAMGVGVGYLDRRDIGLIPLFGLAWVPNPDTRFELYPPKPRIERRIQSGSGFDDWLYVGGELGGGQWAIDRANGTHDVASYYDWRVLLGVERRSLCGGLGGLAEVAYVFGRHLEFASSTPTYDPPDTVMVRLGVIY